MRNVQADPPIVRDRSFGANLDTFTAKAAAANSLACVFERLYSRECFLHSWSKRNILHRQVLHRRHSIVFTTSRRFRRACEPGQIFSIPSLIDDTFHELLRADIFARSHAVHTRRLRRLVLSKRSTNGSRHRPQRSERTHPVLSFSSFSNCWRLRHGRVDSQIEVVRVFTRSKRSKVS